MGKLVKSPYNHNLCRKGEGEIKMNEDEILEMFDKCSIEIRQRIKEEVYLSSELKEGLVTSIIDLLKIVNDTATLD